MPMIGPVLLVVFALIHTGCTVYDIQIRPPLEPPISSPPKPLDLAIKLGSIQLFVNGMPVEITPEDRASMERDFARDAVALHFVREVRPTAESADLTIDMT